MTSEREINKLSLLREINPYHLCLDLAEYQLNEAKTGGLLGESVNVFALEIQYTHQTNIGSTKNKYRDEFLDNFLLVIHSHLY